MINGDGYQRESRKENGSYKMVSLFNRVVKKSLTEKIPLRQGSKIQVGNSIPGRGNSEYQGSEPHAISFKDQ